MSNEPTRKTSRAAVFHGPGAPLEIRQFPLPVLNTGEVLVRVSCCTLCGSDLHSYRGRRAVPIPTILGHEIVGHVAALPPGEAIQDLDGQPLREGDRITWSICVSCGECFFCTRGLPQKCVSLFKYGHQRIEGEHALSGGMADYCHLESGTAILKVPDSLPDRIVCPASCATATVAAAFRLADGCREDVVLVQGAGMLGITACAMARAGGARVVIATDVSADRLEVARRFGAGKVVDVSSGDSGLRELVLELTQGRGADIALELAGSTASLEQGLGGLRTGGCMLMVGAVFPDRAAAIAPEQVVRKSLTIRGLHNYIPDDLRRAVVFLSESGGAYPFDDLVEGSFSLDAAADAFEYAERTRAFRVAVLPSAGNGV